MSSGELNQGFEPEIQSENEESEIKEHRLPRYGLRVMRINSIDIGDLTDPSTKRRSSVMKLPDSLKNQEQMNTYLTNEVRPHQDHYRNILSFPRGKPDHNRPTLEELLEVDYGPEKTAEFAKFDIVSLDEPKREPEPQDQSKFGKAIKLGWIKGVYIPCLLNIWGVMLFLRLTWVVGQAGLLEGLAIISIANLVTFVTALSMSAVSTNGQIKGGGVYYMISRSLGPEFGGAIGLMFTLANTIAVAMYLIGFCESLLDMLKQYVPDFNGIVDASDRVNDIRFIGSISLILILILAIVGMDWVTRIQIGLLVILLVAQLDFIIGTFIPPSQEQISKGFLGYSASVVQQNLWNAYESKEQGHEETHGFFSVFAVFFPAVTGIVAGANLSGDLKDPASSIPKGTLLAVFTTYISYIVYAVLSACSSIRYASGIPNEVNSTQLYAVTNETIWENVTRAFTDCKGRQCEYGLLVSQQMMEVMSAWGPLIYLGCFAATLSSAVASLVGAPRVFMAVAKDKLFPFIDFFGVGYGPSNNPIRGYFLVCFVSLICLLIANLNIVSSLLSNFFVAAYALINFSVFHASMTNSPGWRPAFKYYNKWVSLFGTVLCIAVMFLMDYITALITFIVIISLYMWVYFRNPEVNWGSSSQSQTFVLALKSAQTLINVEDHVKNYRPKLLVLSGKPEDRPCLIDFANLITKNLSLLECANIVPRNSDWKKLEKSREVSKKWLIENKIKAFIDMTRNDHFAEGVRCALELSGLGKLSPNMLLIGFNSSWKADQERANEYLKAIQFAFDLKMSVGVLRLKGGLDITPFASSSGVAKVDGSDASGLNTLGNETSLEENIEKTKVKKQKKSKKRKISKKDKEQSQEKHETTYTNSYAIERFRGKFSKEGTIDVYWLFDDGGLTLLLPHILSLRPLYSKCQLRVFFMAEKVTELDAETRSMASLLSKFRITCKDVIALPDLTRQATQELKEEFYNMIDGIVSRKDLDTHAKRTNFYLRLAEIVRYHSSHSHVQMSELDEDKNIKPELVVMTLPLMKKTIENQVPPLLYMAWLDIVSKNMPPFLFTRGNQDPVLTFYS